MTIESAFELIGFTGTLAAVSYYGRGMRRTLPSNSRLALDILLTVCLVKYAINAAEWSGLFTTIHLDDLEDYLDGIWPFAWFLFFFTSIMDMAARRLRHSEERFRQLVETNPDAVFCHRAGMIEIANPAAAELFGASSSEELVGRDFYSMVHADDVERLKSRREHIVQTRLSVPLTRAKFIQIDGRVIDVEVAGALVAMDLGAMVQTVARDITATKLAERDRERLIADLQGALAEVRTLSGLLPICAKCKNIRDDRGYWNKIESYISKHSKAEFSHSICPDCAKALYPDLHMQLK